MDWLKKEKEDEQITLDFFNHVDFSKITEEPKILYLEDRWILDTFYRIYHHSFKMYYLREYAIDSTKEMLSLIGEEDFSDIPFLLEKWRLDKIFIESFKTINALKFDHSKNEETIWFKEATALSGCFINIVSVVYSTKKFLYELKKNLEESILSKAGFLNSHEALFLEAWESLGSTLRYRGKTDIRDRVKEIVLTKLGTNNQESKTSPDDQNKG